ncbi:hypothetical protein GCM10011371_02740 [Novosphingobium marinum]|uniref:Carbon monoxide dehydrogenase subunit G n=1 Tax=Novosphingobium marinum TaxID=1514948 RepID=A0A7Z0BRL9_9SPHN|nr:SRPBCC family protein [Novosphingobium marinum]NYH93966.1 carbon monoxide dehydrogenase subunit G [Novosphingobium marinum]GGC18618.1 hypothetical protein GCM10011371_02740 [Novosphingobium marinum]
MPEVKTAREVRVSPSQAWSFVSAMDNWAPLLTGYVDHRVIDDVHSEWTVRGELAGLSRVAKFAVAITEWNEPDAIAFRLEGLDEPFTGSGRFAIGTGELPDQVAESGEPARRGLFARLVAWITRFLIGSRKPDRGAPQAPGAAASRLSCTLEVLAHGGSGPMVNLLLPGILEAVASDTADRIVSALEAKA